MKSKFSHFLIIVSVACLGVSRLNAGEEGPLRRFGVGINYSGAQLNWRMSKKWTGEARFQTGKNVSDSIETKSHVVGIRTYRFLQSTHHFSPYWGLEGAFVSARESNASYKTSGLALASFGGVGISLTRHFLLTVDIGPYFIVLKESTNSIDQSEIDFVGDTSLAFYF